MATMGSFIVANAFTLLLLLLIVSANDELPVKEGADSKTEYIEQFIERTMKSESEKSSTPELALLQKEESTMKRVKSLPESENVSRHESADREVTGANDNTHNEAVPHAFMPLLQNDSALVHRDNTINSPATTRSTVPVKNRRLPVSGDEQSEKLTPSKGTNGNLAALLMTLPSPPSHPESTNNRRKLAATLKESSSTPDSNGIEESTIGPSDFDVVADIVSAVLFGTTEAQVTGAFAEPYTEDLVTGVSVVEDLAKAQIDGATGQPQSETSTSAFTETSLDNQPLLELAIAAFGNSEPEATTQEANTAFLPVDKFDFFVCDDKSNIPCILMSMNVTLSVPYETKDRKHITIGSYTLPNELLVSGHCGDEASSMTLSWRAGDSPLIHQNNITLDFLTDNSSFYLDSVHINIALDSHNFPNANDAYITGNSSTNLQLFSAPVHNAIHICPTETKVTSGNIVATISNVAVIAFNKAQRLSNRTAEDYCGITSDDEYDRQVGVSNLIAGIVGAVIALALVIASFSCCRRRSDISLRSELP